MPSIRIYPDALEIEQQHTLGIVDTDKGGDDWSYVEFPAGTYTQGQIVRDSLPADIVGNSGVGSVTAAAAIGTRELKDTGEFSAKQYLRGAIGEIYQGGGHGQKFIVVGVPDANTLIISVEGKGWEVALTTASRYNLILPGRAIVATAGTPFVRGVIQREGFTVPANETRYAWVKMTGFLRAQKDRLRHRSCREPRRCADHRRIGDREWCCPERVIYRHTRFHRTRWHSRPVGYAYGNHRKQSAIRPETARTRRRLHR